jgi:hypothetical protein
MTVRISGQCRLTWARNFRFIQTNTMPQPPLRSQDMKCKGSVRIGGVAGGTPRSHVFTLCFQGHHA